MKILITGQNSYIGTSFETWAKQQNPDWVIDTIDVRGDEWKKTSFSEYDSIFHVAGIAHVSSDPKMKELYYKVNRDLTIDLANKAKNDGVKQFVFMSSIIVYGSKYEVITKDTVPNPDNFYGDSKLQADLAIQKLQSENFQVASIRPPMIYGKGSKGNFPKLAKLAKYTPIFPDYPNQRSMLYIDNLCEFIRLIIDNQSNGYYYPQNAEYVNTSKLVKELACLNNKSLLRIKLFNPVIALISNKIVIVNKVFGNMVYQKELSDRFMNTYQKVDFIESLKKTLEDK